SSIVYASVESFATNFPKYETRVTSLGGQLMAFVQRIFTRLGIEAPAVNPVSGISMNSITAIASSSVGTFLNIMSTAFLVLLFMFNYVPNFGSLIATVFPVAIALLQFDTLTRPILVLILLVVVQNILGNVIEPKLMSFSLNLSPVLILISLIFWGWLWGVLG